MKLRVAIRDLEAADLADLEWSGGPEHVRAVAEALQAGYAGQAAVLAAHLANDRLVGLGAVDFRVDAEAGLLWMLSVHQRFRSLGIGSALIGELQARTLAEGRSVARLLVEQDNPEALALYSRLGYRVVGSALDHWPVAGGRTYVAACLRLERRLGERR